jgi:hypothetical protein
LKDQDRIEIPVLNQRLRQRRAGIWRDSSTSIIQPVIPMSSIEINRDLQPSHAAGSGQMHSGSKFIGFHIDETFVSMISGIFDALSSRSGQRSLGDRSQYMHIF